ncbi:MAG: hypothetical protein ACREUI_09175, partial [Burkholderiales bacterium]
FQPGNGVSAVIGRLDQKREEYFQDWLFHATCASKPLRHALASNNLAVFDRIEQNAERKRNAIRENYRRYFAELEADRSTANQAVREDCVKYGLSFTQLAGQSFPKHISHLGAFLGLESIANTGLFAMGSDIGILGGFLSAIQVSGLSVFAMFLWGKVLRAAQEQSSAVWRALANVGTLIVTALLTIYHSVVAWYRHLLEYSNRPDDAVRTAGEFFFKYRFDIPDILSWYLLLIGLIFGVLSAVTGYRGYVLRAGWRLTRLQRKLSRCEKSELKSITRNDTKAAKQVESARKSLVKSAEKMMSARQQAAMMIVKGGNDIEWIGQQSTRLVDLYRNVSRKVSGNAVDLSDKI